MEKARHYIYTEDFTPDDFREIIRRAEMFQNDPAAAAHLCDGKVIATMFFKESTRTAVSFQSAMQKMGGGWIGIQGIAGTYIASGEEDEEDTLRSVAPFADIMAIRHNYLDLKAFADTFPIPMINGMVGMDEHTIAGAWYLYALYKQFGKIDGLKIGIYGQNKNCRPYKTLEKVVSMFGGQIIEDSVVEELGTPQHIIDFVESHGGSFKRDKLENFIGDVDLLCVTDGLPSSKEDPKLMEEYNKNWHTMTNADFAKMHEGAIFTYMQPRAMTDGRLTVAKEVDSDPRLFNQPMMANGVWANMAVITYLLNMKV